MSYLAPPAPRPRASAVFAALFLVIGATACVDKAAEHRVRANAFLRGGDAAGALKEIDDGLGERKNDVPLLILRGKALFELDRFDESRGAYQAAVDAAKGQDPRSLAEAHLGLGMIATRQKDWAAARKQFEILVSINDKDGASHLNVAKTCLELKDLECAVSHAEAAGRVRGNEEPVLYTLGTVYLAAGKLKEAELTFQHICEVAPGVASCPYGLALVAAKSGDKKKAIEQLDDAVRRKLPNPDRIAADPGFAGIKDDPEFQKIVARAATP
jgi:tetratricopeptide (TPR) repeat protein